jgi:hypothetical protein
MADAARVSLYYFHQRFRLYFGQTPPAAMARLKVTTAA